MFNLALPLSLPMGESSRMVRAQSITPRARVSALWGSFLPIREDQKRGNASFSKGKQAYCHSEGLLRISQKQQLGQAYISLIFYLNANFIKRFKQPSVQLDFKF